RRGPEGPHRRDQSRAGTESGVLRTALVVAVTGLADEHLVRLAGLLRDAAQVLHLAVLAELLLALRVLLSALRGAAPAATTVAPGTGRSGARRALGHEEPGRLLGQLQDLLEGL